MDILYIIGKGSTWNNNELRYSLRSIAKYGINVSRVFMAGYIPDFINKENIICISVEDITNVKHYNILHAIEVTIEKTDIGINDNGDFLYSSDDHYYMQPTDFANYPVYWRGKELPAEIKPGDKHARYHRTLLSTRQLLEKYNLPVYHLAWHGNTHFNSRLWNDDIMKKLREESYTMPEGCEPTCLMNNYRLSIEPFEIVSRKDKKIQWHENEQSFIKKTKDREVFSSSSIIENSYMASWLKKEFPDKCKYEI